MGEQTASKVPQIRFKGFEGAWEEDQLGERVEFFSGLTYSPRSVQKGVGTLVLRSSNVKNGEIVDADNVYVDPSIVNSKNVEVGDIAVVVRNGSRSLIGKHAQIKQRMDSTVIGAFMTGIHSKVPAFTNALLDTPQFDKEIAKNLGATINQITTGAFKQMMFRFPHDTEQEQVGEYFRELDSLMRLHQRKYEKLVTLKKSMLQKMFPQPGATTPEVRFKGFTGKWMAKKVYEICDGTYGGGTPRTSERKFWEGTIPWIQSSDIIDGEIYNVVPRKRISDLALRKSPAKLVPANSVAIVTRVGVGKLALIEFDYASSQDFLSLSKLKLDQSFAAASLSVLLQSKLHETQGTSIKGITKGELLAYTLVVPCAIDEQRKIGSYFRTLDALISQHATQLQKFQQIKSACLERMFV